MAIASLFPDLEDPTGGIDPRLFLLAAHDNYVLTPEDERRVDTTTSSSGEEDDSDASEGEDDVSRFGQSEDLVMMSSDQRIQLPITMYFRCLWKGKDNEQYPVMADLLFVSDHVLLHQVRPHPQFPDHFSGKHFSHLSTSALYIKPTEQNGYTAWFFRSPDGKFRPLKDARTMFGFRNFYKERPSVQLAPRIIKDVLLRMADMAQTPNPIIVKHVKTSDGSKKKKKKRCPNVSSSVAPWETSPPQDVVSWDLTHAVKALLDYLVEVFPGSSKYVTVAVDSGQGTQMMDIEPACKCVFPHGLPNTMGPQSNFNLLGCFIVHSLQSKGYMNEITISTNCSNIQTALHARLRPKELFLALGDLLEFFDPKRSLQFYPFTLSPETLSIYRQGKAYKNVRMNDVLDELAYSRHVEFNVAKNSVIRDTPLLFANVCPPLLLPF